MSEEQFSRTKSKKSICVKKTCRFAIKVGQQQQQQKLVNASSAD